MVYTVVDDCGIAQTSRTDHIRKTEVYYSKCKKYITAMSACSRLPTRLHVFIQIGIIHSDTWKIGSRSVNNFKVKVKFSQGQSVIKILLSTTTMFVLVPLFAILEVNVVT